MPAKIFNFRRHNLSNIDDMHKTTESASNYQHIDKMTTIEILQNMNKEDTLVPLAIAKALPNIEKAVSKITQQINAGGRLFYIGAGTSGRLGIIDAAECPPTFGVKQGLVIGIIAGGDAAIKKAVEFAEDNTEMAWADLQQHQICTLDVVVGIAASGYTPYTINALKKCQEQGITTVCITCNTHTPIANVADYPIEVIVGPEFISGSTRLKAGTAQKLVLNMISTAAMIKLGKIINNKMVDMQLTNQKLVDRGIYMLMDELQISFDTAKQLLQQYGNVRNSLLNYKNNTL